mmetsp:Transcript_116909/g.249798  ORF Transcript_116909/g.249798 Transcript_116909/m.249798 type:complete len:249 (-) Transcript_116909:76-822(-)
MCDLLLERSNLAARLLLGGTGLVQHRLRLLPHGRLGCALCRAIVCVSQGLGCLQLFLHLFLLCGLLRSLLCLGLLLPPLLLLLPGWQRRGHGQAGRAGGSPRRRLDLGLGDQILGLPDRSRSCRIAVAASAEPRGLGGGSRVLRQRLQRWRRLCRYLCLAVTGILPLILQHFHLRILPHVLLSGGQGCGRIRLGVRARFRNLALGTANAPVLRLLGRSPKGVALATSGRLRARDLHRAQGRCPEAPSR